MTRTPAALRGLGALTVAVALGGLLLAACSDPEPASPPTAPRVLVDEQPPRPAPVPVDPEKRKFDADGDLIESVNDLFGFRLPAGVKRVSQSPGAATLEIVTKMDPLVRFYTTRGYQVIQGEGGYTVRHSRATLEGLPNADDVAAATLYLRDGTARRKELRFFGPAPTAARSPADRPLEIGPPPPADAPEAEKQRYERLRAWQEAHPGEPLPY